MELEEKTFPLEIKAVKADGTFEGYLSVFGVKDSFNDIVDKGAFKKTLEEKKKFPLLNYHDPEGLLGDFTGNEDDYGLFITGALELEVQKAKEKYALMKRGSLKGLSMGFRTVQDEYEEDGETRHLKEANLFEGSLVTFAACPGADILNVKSMFELKNLVALVNSLREEKNISAEKLALAYQAYTGLEALLDGYEPPELGTRNSIVKPPGIDFKPLEHLKSINEELRKLLEIY